MTPGAGEREDAEAVRSARAFARQRAVALERDDCADSAALVMSELVANAVLHGGGCLAYDVRETQAGVRVEVRDASTLPPVLGHLSGEALTGRGMHLVAAVARRWGAEPAPPGKVVWAEVAGDGSPDVAHNAFEFDLAQWDLAELEGPPRFRVELGDVPTDLLLEAKNHVDGVVREFALATSGARAGLTADVPPQLSALLADVVDRFSDARLSIKHQALDAARRGLDKTHLVLELTADAADAAEKYIAALDEVDGYCRARRLLTLETPPKHRVFRDWYVNELVTQLRAAAAGDAAPTPLPFERRLLHELDRVTVAQRAIERAARLYAVAAALVTADTAEAVAEVVLEQGVAALRASGGGVLLASETDTLRLPGAVGYDADVVARLRNESRDADLPAAVALRTGEAVWLESRAERDQRFPELVGLEATTVSLCAVPLELRGTRLGALRFSFDQPKLFDEDERRFVHALAAETAEALDRAQLQQSLARAVETERAARQALDRENRLIDSLSRVGQAVTARLDLDEVVQQVTDAATSLTGAAFGAFFYNVIDDAGESYVLYALSGAPREAFEDFPLPRNTQVFSPTFNGDEVVRLGDVTRDQRFGKNAPYFGMPKGHLSVRSYMAIPVKSVDGSPIGGLFFGHPEPDQFGAEEEHLVSGIAGYAAVAMENARLYDDAQRQLRALELSLQERQVVSRALERPLIAPSMPHVQGLDLAAVYKPFGDSLKVGGDFYDAFQVDDARWAVVIGDVSGKGPEAAALTGLARPTLWTAGRTGADPARMLELLNEAIVRSPTELFCTAAAAILDTTQAPVELQLALGGHPPPVLVRAAGSASLVAAEGPLVGTWSDATYETTRIALQSGDAIVFYTDGVTEGGGTTTLDDADLTRFLAGFARCPASDMAEALVEEAIRRRRAIRDDIAVLVARVP